MESLNRFLFELENLKAFENMLTIISIGLRIEIFALVKCKIPN